MKRVAAARFMRSVQNDSTTTAEVEFALEDGGSYIAIIEKEGSGSFALSRIFRQQEQHDLDWFNNPLHDAYPDVTAEFADMDGHVLVESILATQDVRKDMDTE